MEKNERILFHDIPSGGGGGMFHSAVLTTYAVDLIHLDTHVRSALRRKQVCSINVFADNGQMDNALQYVNPVYLRHIGQDCCITAVRSRGAFHPKINFLASDNAAMVLVGSGNLTVTGHGKNHELFTGFMVSQKDERQLPLIQECWQYICRIAKRVGDYEQRRVLQEIPDNCAYLHDIPSFTRHQLHKVNKGLQAALLYNEEDGGIYSQMASIIPTKRVKRITVVSPYFDRNGEALTALLSMCPNATMDVLIQTSCTRPPTGMAARKDIRFYDFDKTSRGKKMIGNGFKRLAHAKAFLFDTDKETYCVIGSANATIAALGTPTARGINDELCVLYRSSTVSFQEDLGLVVHKRDTLKLSDIVPSSKEDVNSRPAPIRLIGANYDNGRVEVECEKDAPPTDVRLVVESNGALLTFNSFCIKGKMISQDVELGKCTALCYLENDKGEAVSNKVFINNLTELNATNPSPSTRNLNRIIAKIESDDVSGFDLVEMLNEVMYNVADCESRELHSHSGSANKTKLRDAQLPDIHYNAAYDNDDTTVLRSVKVDKMSRLLECIENSIRMKRRSLDEELKDEEEEGDTETSNERADVSDKTISLDKTYMNSYNEIAAKLLRNYTDLVTRGRKAYKGNEGKITKDDLALFALAMYGATEICYLSRFRYKFDRGNSQENSICQKQLHDGFDHVMETDGMKALSAFADYCKSFIVNTLADDDFRKKGHRAMKYALLYATGINRYSTIPNIMKQVRESMQMLVEIFGLPDKEQMRNELLPLFEQYDYIIKMKYIEDAIKTLGLAWD